MKSSRPSAFTLIELLVVISIIGVLAGIIVPIYGSVQLSGKKVQSLNNLRQLATATLSYAGDHNGALPGPQSNATPGWTTSNTEWYNALPRDYMNSPNLSEYANHTADFYKKGSVFFVPAAVYPSSTVKTASPSVRFGVQLEAFYPGASPR